MVNRISEEMRGRISAMLDTQVRSQRQIAYIFKVSRMTVFRINQNRRAYKKGLKPPTRKRQKGRPVFKRRALLNDLTVVAAKTMSQETKLTNKLLRDIGLAIGRKLGIRTFKASKNWITSFRGRQKGNRWMEEMAVKKNTLPGEEIAALLSRSVNSAFIEHLKRIEGEGAVVKKLGGGVYLIKNDPDGVKGVSTKPFSVEEQAKAILQKKKAIRICFLNFERCFKAFAPPTLEPLTELKQKLFSRLELDELK